MLFQPAVFCNLVGSDLIMPVAILTVLFFALMIVLGLRAHSRKVITGNEGLIGETGIAFSDLNTEGKVLVHGEIWAAKCSVPLARNAPIRVVAKHGMMLTVELFVDQAS